jgi:hypothetical protein
MTGSEGPHVLSAQGFLTYVEAWPTESPDDVSLCKYSISLLLAQAVKLLEHGSRLRALLARGGIEARVCRSFPVHFLVLCGCSCSPCSPPRSNRFRVRNGIRTVREPAVREPAVREPA